MVDRVLKAYGTKACDAILKDIGQPTDVLVDKQRDYGMIRAALRKQSAYEYQGGLCASVSKITNPCIGSITISDGIAKAVIENFDDFRNFPQEMTPQHA